MTIFNKLFLSILLICITSYLKAQMLDDYLKTAAENNPGLKAKYAEFEAAMQKVSQANSLPNPTMSFGYFISPIETKVGPQLAKFNLSQMFPWFGTLAAKGEMSYLMAEAKFQEFLDSKFKLFYHVKAAWYPLYELDRTLRLQEKNKEILYTYKQLATTDFKNNKGDMVDVIRVDIMIESTNTEINLLRGKKKSLLTWFNTLLNRVDTIQVFLPDSIPLIQVESGYRKDSLLTKHPILEALDLKKQSAMAQEKAAKRMGLPSFGVGLDYVIVGDGSINVPDNGKDAIMPMVTISLPIFRGKYKAAVKEAQFTQSAITSYKEDFENSLVSSYENTWFELDQSLQFIDLYREQINKTQQALRLLLTAYSNSGKDFKEVLRMQQELIKYQIAETIALKDYYTALAKLDYLTAKSN